MGDRANCIVTQNQYRESPPVYLYTHWGGYDLPGTVQRALQQERRWDDAPYLTRIIFDVMTDGQHGNETGFGISTEICDNSYPLIVVDVKQQMVRFEDQETRAVMAAHSFTDFCALAEPSYPDESA